jgi:hypothetical protein
MSLLDFYRRVEDAWSSHALAVRALREFDESPEARRKYLESMHPDAKPGVANGRESRQELILQLVWSQRLTESLQQVEGHVHAAYLIVFAAIAEDMMNQCLKAILLDNPLQLGRHKELKLGDLLLKGHAGVVADLVDAEVRDFSHQPARNKLQRLHDRFGVPIELQKLVEDLVEKRNELLHKSPGQGVTAEETEKAHEVCGLLGYTLILCLAEIDASLVADDPSLFVQQGESLADRFPDLGRYKETRARQKSAMRTETASKAAPSTGDQGADESNVGD